MNQFAEVSPCFCSGSPALEALPPKAVEPASTIPRAILRAHGPFPPLGRLLGMRSTAWGRLLWRGIPSRGMLARPRPPCPKPQPKVRTPKQSFWMTVPTTTCLSRSRCVLLDMCVLGLGRVCTPTARNAVVHRHLLQGLGGHPGAHGRPAALPFGECCSRECGIGMDVARNWGDANTVWLSMVHRRVGGPPPPGSTRGILPWGCM